MSFVYNIECTLLLVLNYFLQTSVDPTSIDNGLLQSIKLTRTIAIGVCGSLALVLVFAGGIVCYFWQKIKGRWLFKQIFLVV